MHLLFASDEWTEDELCSCSSTKIVDDTMLDYFNLEQLYSTIATQYNLSESSFYLTNQTGKILYPRKELSLLQDYNIHPDNDAIIIHKSGKLIGGKGGFGSLLRGQSTRAGQKKTTNFGAMRDLSGRRVRDVQNEQKLKKWFEEKEQREKEKAEKKKQIKTEAFLQLKEQVSQEQEKKVHSQHEMIEKALQSKKEQKEKSKTSAPSTAQQAPQKKAKACLWDDPLLIKDDLESVDDE